MVAELVLVMMEVVMVVMSMVVVMMAMMEVDLLLTNSLRAALYGPKPEYTELDLDDKDCVNGNWRCYYKWLSENTPDQWPAIKTSKYLASHGVRLHLHLIMRLIRNLKGGQIRGCQCMKRAPPSPASPHKYVDCRLPPLYK